MKPDYLNSFPTVRYSSSGLIKDSDMKQFCRLLGGSDAAKYFLLKTEGNLNAIRIKIDIESHNNHTVFSQCEMKLESIKKHSSALSVLFKSMVGEELIANDPKDWRTFRMLSQGIGHWEFNEWKKGFPPTLYEVAQYLEKVARGASTALETIDGEKGVVWNPLHSFVRDVIFNYQNFFKKYPPIYRGSKFVEVVDDLIDIGGIGAERRGVTTYKILKNELDEFKNRGSTR